MKTSTFASQNKNIFRFAIVTLLLLLVPFIAMQFSEEVNWTVQDFIVAGLLLFGAGVIYDLATRKTDNTKRKIIIGAVVLILLGVVWVQLAAGIAH